MAQIIEEERFLVEEQGSSEWPGSTTETHIWFKVLEGPDQGLKLSIPLYSKEYSETVEEDVHSLSQGDLVCASLRRKNNEEPWKVTEIHTVNE